VSVEILSTSTNWIKTHDGMTIDITNAETNAINLKGSWLYGINCEGIISGGGSGGVSGGAG